jgi:putative sigma-54 modulation protein
MTSLNVQCRNCEVDDALRAHCEEKISSLDKIWPRGEEAAVRFSMERGRFVAEITLVSTGLLLRGEERGDNLRQAFDLAVDKLHRQLDRFKKKSMSAKRRHNNRDDVAGVVMHPVAVPDVELPNSANGHLNGGAEASAEEDSDVVVRTKRFALKPMSPQEATQQMDLLGHDFFVFRDATSNDVSVVYRRQGGGYGLIEPVAD